MGQPAARVTDPHVCPMFDGPKPHVGGPILPPGKINILIGGLPASTVFDMATCVSVPDMVKQGSMSVLFNGMPAARMGDMTVHNGVIVMGCPTVLIGGPSFTSNVVPPETQPPTMMDKVLDFFGLKSETPPVPPLTEFQKANEAMLNESIIEARVMLMQKKAALDRWNADDKAAVKKWMGDDSEATRKMLQERTQRELDSAYKLTPGNFSQMDTSDPDYGSTYAQVYPNDKTHNIQIGGAFAKAPASGVNSRGGTIVHELSHFNDVGGTKDHKYGTTKAQQLAIDDPSKAQNNADSYEYYIEH